MFRRIEVIHEYRGEYFKSGAGGMLGVVMCKLGLKAPDVKKPNTKFFFTEKGWDKFGRKLLVVANKAGFAVKVRAMKEHGAFDVFYCDEYQVAIRFRNGGKQKIWEREF